MGAGAGTAKETIGSAGGQRTRGTSGTAQARRQDDALAQGKSETGKRKMRVTATMWKEDKMRNFPGRASGAPLRSPHMSVPLKL